MIAARYIALRARAQLGEALSWWSRQPHQVPAALLLLTTWLAFYAWAYVPEHLQAEAWNMGGALGRLLLLWLVVLAYRSVPVAAAALWWSFEDAQVVGCGLLWLIDPWQVTAGEGRCSDRFGLPMGLVGAALGSLAAWVVLHSAWHDRGQP